MKVLIAPLDWGLGHATRCIPLIQYLLEKKIEVHIAGSGASLELLKKNFRAKLAYHSIPAYNISYSRRPGAFSLKILLQLPKIIRTIRKEHKAVSQLAGKEGYGLIISDNRYGAYHYDIPSVIMTHQYQILSGYSALTDGILLRKHKQLLQKFREVWIVDDQKESTAIAGRLSHPSSFAANAACYIGHLSQFTGGKDTVASVPAAGNRILLLLSGPEPARSQLLRLIIKQAIPLKNYSFHIIAGSDLDIPSIDAAYTHIRISGLCSQREIEEKIHISDMILCRSGYSSLMDLVALKKKALLIPTPGQTEQEYLADHLMKKNIFYSVSQAELDLSVHLEKAFEYTGFADTTYSVNQQFIPVIDRWIAGL